VLRGARAKNVGIIRGCPSMICKVSWLRMNLCPTTSCGLTTEVELAAAPKSDENSDEDQMDDMIPDFHREYDPDSEEQIPQLEV
jgi:hypothetical protein